MNEATGSTKTLVGICSEIYMLSSQMAALSMYRQKALNAYNGALDELSWVEAVAHAFRIPLAGTVLAADALKKRYLELDQAVADCRRKQSLAHKEKLSALRGMSVEDCEACLAAARVEVETLFSITN